MNCLLPTTIGPCKEQPSPHLRALSLCSFCNNYLFIIIIIFITVINNCFRNPFIKGGMLPTKSITFFATKILQHLVSFPLSQNVTKLICFSSVFISRRFYHYQYRKGKRLANCLKQSLFWLLCKLISLTMEKDKALCDIVGIRGNEH